MTIITLRCDERSNERLRRYLQNNGISGKSEFHTTLFYNEEFPFFEADEIKRKIERKFKLPIILDSTTYHFGLLGDNTEVLTLGYRNYKIESLRDSLCEQAVRQIFTYPFEEYTPEESEIILRYGVKVTGISECDSEIGTLPLALRCRKSPVYLDSPLHISLANNYRGSIEDLSGLRGPLVFSELRWRHQEHL